MTVSPALPARPSSVPPAFHLLAKPTGAAWQGVANLAASFFRGMPAGGSLSGTALVVSSRARLVGRISFAESPSSFCFSHTWPDVMCIAILKYPSQLEKAKERGADLALIDGVSAEQLLAALEGKYT